jgi:hypothetical protein
MSLRSPSPLALRPGYLKRQTAQAHAAVAAVTCLVVLAVAIVGLLVRPLLREQAVWARGVPATHVQYDGQKSTDRFFNDFTLRVTYDDADGVSHHQRLEFGTLLFGIDQETPPEVRFDPAAPDIFALNIAVGAAPSRWTYSLALGIWPLFPAAFAIRGARMLYRRVRRARQCVLDGRPVAVEVVFPRPVVMGNGKVRYDYRLTNPDGSVLRAHVDFEGTHGPVFIGGKRGQTHLLAIQSQSDPEALLVVRDDLYPLDLPKAEVDRIAAEAFVATDAAYR